jgi:formylglycine-generating enzyme required for sulfatase activity/uncharacterized caspase-like protein
MPAKYALIIGNTEYSDSGLAKLNAPGKDAEDFARALKSVELAAFDEVVVFVNENVFTLNEAIEEFFTNKRPDDLLIFYFSGHGVRDESGSLFLAVKNTNRAKLRSTAIKADFVRELMDQSRSKRQVIILDCCNSGAFAHGTKAETGGSMGIATAFEGKGYGHVVLTATDSTQFAWEGDKIIGEEITNSLFTYFLVKGLEGEADEDGDGKITVDELYDYAYEQIVSRTPKQTPGKWSYKQQGEIVLRQNAKRRDVIPLEKENLESKRTSHEKTKRVNFPPKLKIPALVLFAALIGYLLWQLMPPNSVVNPAETETPQAMMTATLTAVPPTKILTPAPTLGIGSTLISDEDGATLVYVPEGEFIMGSDADDALAECKKFGKGCQRNWFANEEPPHSVYLDAFWIDKTEVTNALYVKCVDEGACRKPANASSETHPRYYGNSEFDNYPVIYVDWNMANAYCSWAGRRLPTEAEWEKAARGPSTGSGDARMYPWGDTFDGSALNFCDVNCSYSWANKSFNDGYADVSPAGNYPSGKSIYGALDLAGNVWEWVNDWYNVYPDSGTSIPDEFRQTYRVLRGGSWYYSDANARSTYRLSNTPDNAYNNAGFRCARSIP